MNSARSSSNTQFRTSPCYPLFGLRTPGRRYSLLVGIIWKQNIAILCDLTATKTNDTGGAGTVGVPFSWTITVANGGTGSAIFADGEVILRDDLPADATYGSPTPGSFTNITNSANISCGIAADTLTCSPSGASVTIGATTGSFAVTFSTTPTAPGSLVNPAGGGQCMVDLGNNITESDEANNGCVDSITASDPQPPEPPAPKVDVPTVGQWGLWLMLVLLGLLGVYQILRRGSRI